MKFFFPPNRDVTLKTKMLQNGTRRQRPAGCRWLRRCRFFHGLRSVLNNEKRNIVLLLYFSSPTISNQVGNNAFSSTYNLFLNVFFRMAHPTWFEMSLPFFRCLSLFVIICEALEWTSTYNSLFLSSRHGDGYSGRPIITYRDLDAPRDDEFWITTRFFEIQNTFFSLEFFLKVFSILVRGCVNKDY